MGALAEAGVDLVGENRQQDLAAKHERWGDAFEWDFIGNLQSRKVKQVLPLCRLIHSVATDSVLAQLGATATPETEVLVEVNVAGEEGKGGVAPADLAGLHRALPGPGRRPDDDAAVQPGPGGLAAPFRPPRRARRRPTAWRGSRWAPRRTGGSRSRRGRRSSASAPRCSCESALTSSIIRKGVGPERPKHAIPMALRDTWHKALVYFGLAEDHDYGPEYEEEFEPETGSEEVFEARRERDQGSVRRLPTSRRARRDEIDDIFADDEPIAASRTRTLRPVDNGGARHPGPPGHPRNFNDAQQVADQFKRSVPVILNLQTADHELSKRMIDFCSGLTYALDGGMQRIAEKMFLLTPRNVEVSAEEKARLIDKGFFNQS